jgi:triacylglycerol esterase/lipase EstA (alpha/beta hydrolase family)
MKSKFIPTILILSLAIALPFLFGESISDRPIVLIHGLGGSSEDMETMKNGLIKKGVPENNIRLINLPEKYGSIIENAQYVGNEIKKISEEFSGKKVMVVGYSMGGEIADFLTKNQEEKVTYSYKQYPYITISTPLGDIEYRDTTKIETVTRTIDMPTHIEKYADEVIMIGSGPSYLALLKFEESLRDKKLVAYQDLTPYSDLQTKLNNMSSNPLVVYNTISGTKTWGSEKDDDVVPNEYSQRDYAKNNYPADGITHTELNKALETIKLVLDEINNGALSDEEIQTVLEYQKDNLTLQKNMKQQSLSGILKNAPCGANTSEITGLQNEINSIGQEIVQIDGQLGELGGE